TAPLHRIPIRDKPHGIVAAGAGRYIFVQEGKPDGFVDCRSDEQALRTALSNAAESARKRDAQVPEFASTKKFIASASEALTAAPADALERTRLERALQIVDEQEAVHGCAEVLADMVLAFPQAQATIHEEARQARAQAEREAQDTMSQSLAGEERRLAGLRHERAGLE